MKTKESVNPENFDESLNDFEFEILAYSPKVDLKNSIKTIEKEELNHENKIKTFVNNVMRSALKIIFDSRNLKNVFYTKSQKDIDDLHSSFEIDIDDLLMDEYEDLKHIYNTNENSVRRKNIVIEFLLVLHTCFKSSYSSINKSSISISNELCKSSMSFRDFV